MPSTGHGPTGSPGISANHRASLTTGMEPGPEPWLGSRGVSADRLAIPRHFLVAGSAGQGREGQRSGGRPRSSSKEPPVWETGFSTI